jgi:metallo-beta-lactamase family protein
VKLNGFSAHADRNEMLHFLKTSGLRVKRIAVVHGEEAQSTAFCGLLRQNGYEAMVPMLGQTIVVK